MTMRYLLDLSKLQPADIVLETGTKPHSRMIMAATRGHYSHALLYTHHMLMEATVGGGVFSKNPQRLLVRKEAHLGVYRMREPLSSSAVKAIITAASQRVGSLYAMDEAARVMHRGRVNPATTGQFCSRLVAQCYAAAGISLVPTPDFCSPHDLAQSPLLEPVQETVRPARDSDLEFAGTLDINRRNQKATMSWLRGVRRIASRENQTIATQSDVLPFLLLHPKYDTEVMECIRRTPYLENLHHDRVVNPYRYDAEAFLKRITYIYRQAHDILQEELGKEPQLIDRFGLNLQAYRQHAHFCLSFVDEHINLYDGLLAMTEERLLTILNAISALRLQQSPYAMHCSSMLQKVQALRG